MTKVLLCGACGRMGRVVASLAQQYDCVVVAGVDIASDVAAPFPIYKSIDAFPGSADVIIDFSHISTLPSILAYVQAHRTPAVLATTGYSPEALAQIEAASATVPLFRSANMSLGINLLARLAQKAAAVLGDGFDIEIVEKHHNKKLDAPSGTALILADAAAAGMKEQAQYVYDRHAVRQERRSNEIGIHSVRGGTICGDHDVIFAGFNEVITFSHSVSSREVFASGALKAACFLAGQTENRLYSMNDLFSQI